MTRDTTIPDLIREIHYLRKRLKRLSRDSYGVSEAARIQTQLMAALSQLHRLQAEAQGQQDLFEADRQDEGAVC